VVIQEQIREHPVIRVTLELELAGTPVIPDRVVTLAIAVTPEFLAIAATLVIVGLPAIRGIVVIAEHPVTLGILVTLGSPVTRAIVGRGFRVTQVIPATLAQVDIVAIPVTAEFRAIRVTLDRESADIVAIVATAVTLELLAIVDTLELPVTPVILDRVSLVIPVIAERE